LLVQIDRIFRGFSPYGPVYNADSFTYGPLYLYLLAALDRPFEAVPAIAHLRGISVAIGALSVVPVAFALVALRRRWVGTSSVWESALAWAFTLASYLFVASRDPLAITLHPNTLTLVFIGTAIACVFWYPQTRRKRLVFGILLAACYLDALTKLNSAAQTFFYLAALVVYGGLRLRTAAIAAGAYVAAIGFFYLVVPEAWRQWALVVPAHHPFGSAFWGIGDLIGEWHGPQPWQGVLVLATIALVGWQIWRGDRRQGIAWVAILSGLFFSGFPALLKWGGGVYDLWWFYAGCTIALGSALEGAMRTLDGRARPRFALQGAAVAYALAFGATINSGLHDRVPIDAAGRAAMASTGKVLARLCKPGYRIMVTWFPDPLLRCPGATFQFWDSVEEVTWARVGGYKGKTVMDGPISPDAFVMIREFWSASPQPRSIFPFDLVGRYRIVTYPVYEPIAYGAWPLHLDLFLKKSSFPNGI
jgi:hypothetical protein